MKKAPNQLSFLPEDYLERKAQRRTNVICAVLFLVVMGAIGSAFMLTERSMKDVERQHAAVQQQFGEAAKRIEAVKLMQEQQRKMAHQAELTSSLLEKVPRSNLLAEFTNARPSGVSLLELTLESKKQVKKDAGPESTQTALAKKKAEAKKKAKTGEATAPPPPEPKIYDIFIKLTGVASNDVQVAQFINRLSRSTLLKDVNLVIVDEFELEEAMVRKFVLEMRLDPAADLQASEPSKTASLKVAD